ncbi:MAG: SRPBCC family protein [Pseudomonadota bacterium]
MDIEKILTVAAPPAQVWALLLDPAVMGSCVPGMKSIQVVSDVEYLAEMHVKIAFVSARFKIRTTIVETRPPHYLRSEGTGEDASVASSLKQVSEIFLSEMPDGQTELRMKIKVDVLGRLGTFGLSVMKTKADRMWDEFGVNLAARLAPEGTATAAEQSPATTEPTVSQAGESGAALPASSPAHHDRALPLALPQGANRTFEKRSWLARVLGLPPATQAQRDANDIVIEVRRADSLVTIRWPVQSASACGLWLRDYLK